MSKGASGHYQQKKENVKWTGVTGTVEKKWRERTRERWNIVRECLKVRFEARIIRSGIGRKRRVETRRHAETNRGTEKKVKRERERENDSVSQVSTTNYHCFFGSLVVKINSFNSFGSNQPFVFPAKEIFTPEFFFAEILKAENKHKHFFQWVIILFVNMIRSVTQLKMLLLESRKCCLTRLTLQREMKPCFRNNVQTVYFQLTEWLVIVYTEPFDCAKLELP